MMPLLRSLRRHSGNWRSGRNSRRMSAVRVHNRLILFSIADGAGGKAGEPCRVADPCRTRRNPGASSSGSGSESASREQTAIRVRRSPRKGARSLYEARGR